MTIHVGAATFKEEISIQDNYGIRPSQRGFFTCWTNLIFFQGRETHLVDGGRAVNVVYLDFSKAVYTVSHSIRLEKLAAHGLDGLNIG